ncbi:radical SAM/SPASM domain-containing protein [Gephyromycinifex aptenodytis]|uniref:radical SAM/SPASM domain-containing protein n=1 Tax=Gephyromycinifex aptenodytis TaxID=2716227 RepID=UPI0014467F60|nr:radical SAM protein [Gephyromycinifex aptenodytis]
MPIRSLVLWPTGACDLDCTYCYRGLLGGRMSPATAHAALDLAAQSGLPFHVQFAGGEPTLNPAIIEQVCQRIAAEALPATVAVQTNAARLTPPVLDLLARYRVQVGVSIDGPPQVQEQVRGHARETFAGLGLLAAREIPVRVTAVLSAVNATRLAELALLLAAYPNVVGLALDPLVSQGAARGRDDLLPDPKEVARGITDLHHAVRQIARLRTAPFTWRELETVRRALRPAPIPVTVQVRRPADAPDAGAHPNAVARTPAPYCHAALGQSMAVAPDGTVYPCSQSVGDPARAAGHVGDVDWAALQRQFRDVHLTGPCQECELQGRCPGDCPSRLEAALDAGLEPGNAHLTCLIYRTIATCERTPS